ncbi:DUF3467 domain-containing protein [Halovulum dunhuangense]|uniref:DUF3467 domain-containing protein n=1 Tax=Halovulum dunhuangense TaxID=1505036 RepID=A0A849L296_9RHOB|nr:DUF3467 domain-containing protein [Halovulum dunhuangense]NNU80364.1 DUF3467 domain-containing protein [Halovulum dunhuangense]
MADDAATGKTGTGGDRRSSEIEWNDGAMTTDFANVVNIQGTREQIELFFGTNRSWETGKDGKVSVDLTNRIIMTPYAAKRMLMILSGVLREYETRHGVLKVDER